MRIALGFRFSLALMFVVLVFSPLQLVSQVIIKEKVEIHPKSPPLVRTQSAALLQIVASWSVSGEIDPSPGPGLGMINQPCGITATGELVKTAPAVSGGFFIGASVRTLGSVHYELLVQVGGTEVLRQEGELPGNILFLLQPEVVLHSGVAFHGEQQTLIHGAGTGMKLGTPSEHPLQLCVETIWHQKMPTTFTIVQGAGLGSFYDTLGARIGTSVQWTEETIGAIRFVADGDQPSNPEGEDVIIEASNSTGILGQTTIRVFPFEETIVVDHFEVTAGTDTLEYGSSTLLVIVGKDAEGREPQGEDQDFLVALSLEGGEGSAGSFAVTVPFMDTTFVFPDQFMFSYAVYKSGLFSIAYLANGEFPAGSEPGTVKIKAALETDPEVTGEAQVVVVKESECVRIVFADPVLAPGDTTILAFRKINADGSETEYPAEQLFDVQILAGGVDKGILLSSTGETGITLVATQAPIRYIAPADIEGEEITVQVVASPSSGGTVAASSMTPIPGIKSVSSQRSMVKVREKLLAFAVTSCPINEVSVKVVADNIDLEISPKTIQYSEEASLRVDLRYKNNVLSSENNATPINFYLGPEFESFGSLKNTETGGHGTTITGVPYNVANGGSTKFTADGQEYDGRFPLGISFGVSAEMDGNLLVDVAAAYLFGPNTIGKVYLQSDALWKTDPYDHDNSRTVGGSGCALTCMAMVLKAYGVDIDPKHLNAWMKDPENEGFKGLSVRWETLFNFPDSPFNEPIARGRGLLQDTVSRKWNVPPSTLPSLADMETALAAHRPVIAQVLNPSTNNNHWVVITGKTPSGKYTILDPGGYDRIFISNAHEYKTIYRYVLISPR